MFRNRWAVAVVITAILVTAGNTLLDRGAAKVMEQNGFACLYEGVTQLFTQDDITIANLEDPLTPADGGALKDSQFIFKADADNAKTLKYVLQGKAV